MKEKSHAANGTLPSAKGATGNPSLRYIEEALQGLQFGQITVYVQDGVVIQVERTERRRIKHPARTS